MFRIVLQLIRRAQLCRHQHTLYLFAHTLCNTVIWVGLRDECLFWILWSSSTTHLWGILNAADPSLAVHLTHRWFFADTHRYDTVRTSLFWLFVVWNRTPLVISLVFLSTRGQTEQADKLYNHTVCQRWTAVLILYLHVKYSTFSGDIVPLPILSAPSKPRHMFWWFNISDAWD